MRKLLLILLIISLAAAAFATVLQVSGVGPAAAGENTLPDPVGTVDKVYYVFSGGQITHITVEVSWSVASGTYTIGVEAVDTDVSPPNVLASGETTETNPTGTATYTIPLSSSLGFQKIQAFDTVRVYIVQTA